MSVALTQNVSYTLKPTSVRCHRKQVVIPCANKQTFSASETAQFFLPSLRNNVLDGQSAFLRFSATITTTGRLDNTAHSFIDRIMTYGAGGQLISDIQNYGALANMMTDLQVSKSGKQGQSPFLGTEDDYLRLTWTANQGAGTYPTGNEVAGADLDNVTITDNNRRGMALTTATTYTFCIPLLHPLFTLSEKYFPSFALNDDIRLEITWSSYANALVTSTVFSITNPEIVVDYIEFDSSVFPMIQATYTGSDLVVPAQDYRYYASLIAAGTTGNISQIIPAKQQSARAMFFGFRPAETQAVGAYSLSSRENPFFTAGDWLRLNVGGVQVPQGGIRTRVTGNFAEWMAHTQTALHAFNSLEMNGNINRSYYQASATQTGHQVTLLSYKNGFCVGINLDQLRGQNQTTNSGLSLANVTTYYEGYITTNPVTSGGVAEAVTVDTFVLHDVLFVIAPDGTMTLRA
jgi:hypothetical protein